MNQLIWLIVEIKQKNYNNIKSASYEPINLIDCWNKKVKL